MAKLPNSIADWATWTGWNHWTVAHNFTDAAGSPVNCAAVSDGVAFNLTRLGTTDPALLSAPQALKSTQGGIEVRSAQELLYKGSDANWSVHATRPTLYGILFKLRNDAGGAAQDIYCGQDGTGGGWALQVDASNQLKLRMMAATSSAVSGSSEAGNGRWHFAVVVIDDAGNRGKLVTEWGEVSITSTAYSESGPLICTIGPTHTGATFPKPTSYAVTARGDHNTGWDEATNIVKAFVEYHIRNIDEGMDGADNESTDAEDIGGIASNRIDGGMDAFDSEWPEETIFYGGHTADSATHYGEFDPSAEPLSFVGGFTCESAQHRGAFTCSKIARVSHKQAAMARIVWQLRGNYDNAQCDLTGGITNDSATHGGSYG